MSALLIENVRLIDPASRLDVHGGLLVRDGRIEAVGEAVDAPHDVERMDGGGAVLAPALIDLRARAAEPGAGPERLHETLRRAAAGGIGTLVLAADSGSGIATPEQVEWVGARAVSSPVRLLASGLAVRDGAMAEIGLMLKAGAVYLSDGGIPQADSSLVRRLMAYSAGFEAWFSLRAEDAFLARDTTATEGDLSARLALAARPALSEALAIERNAGLAALSGGRLLVDRVTTREGLAAIANARLRGVEIAATAPITHLMFNEVDAGGFDTRYRLEPPLRAQSDREALIEALSEGRIDAIVSDHTPVQGFEKANPFSDAPPGSAHLEAVLPALCSLVAENRLSLLEALAPVTSGPAGLLGLNQGRLTPGAPADLVLFDPDAPIVMPRVANDPPSAFSGRRLFGRILMTMVDGAIIVEPQP
ncbi:MAG: amidohydrolase family protein [Pseudomonadota bacterium]